MLCGVFARLRDFFIANSIVTRFTGGFCSFLSLREADCRMAGVFVCIARRLSTATSCGFVQKPHFCQENVCCQLTALFPADKWGERALVAVIDKHYGVERFLRGELCGAVLHAHGAVSTVVKENVGGTGVFDLTAAARELCRACTCRYAHAYVLFPVGKGYVFHCHITSVVNALYTMKDCAALTQKTFIP